MRQTISSSGHYVYNLDLGNRFGSTKQWGIRANVNLGDGETPFAHEKLKQHNIFVNVDYKDDTSKVELLLGRRHVKHSGLQTGLRLNGFELPELPSSDANFQIDWAHYRHHNNVVGLSLEKSIADNMELFIKGGYQEDNWDPVVSSYYPRLQDDKGNFKTSVEIIREKNWISSVALGLRAHLTTSKLKHDIVVSFDRLKTSGYIQYDKNFYNGVGPKLEGNIYDSNWIDKYPMPLIIEWLEKETNGVFWLKGASILDRITTNDKRWSFLAGIRYQSVEPGNRPDIHSSAYSPNLGVLYSYSDHVKVYANYMEGLGKGKYVSKRYANKGEYLPPQTTSQYEVGVKWEDKHFAGNISVFSVEQENPYANAQNIYKYYGRQKNQGIQLSLFGDITSKWSVYGGVMYLKSYQKGGANDGKEIVGLPKWNISIATDYKLNENWSLASRFVYNNSTKLDWGHNKRVPAWWRLDAGIKYKKSLENDRELRIGLNIQNILNRKYWVVRDIGEEAVTLQGPRALTLTVSYDF